MQQGQVAAGGAARSTGTDANRSGERVDVSVGAGGQVMLRQQVAPGSESPTGIMVVEVVRQQSALKIEVADFRGGDNIQYRATLPDGSALPAWVKVNPATGEITATPSAGVQVIELRFVAQDPAGNTRTLEIKIDLTGGGQPGAALDPGLGAPQARADFATQLAAQRQQWDGYGEQLLSAFIE